jgi:hypothetical protein
MSNPHITSHTHTHTHTYPQFPIQFTTCDLDNAESGGQFYAKFADNTTTTLAFVPTEGGVNSQTLFMQDAQYAQSQNVTLCAQSSDAWCLESVAMTGVDLGIATHWLDNPCTSSAYANGGTCATCLAVSFVATTQPTPHPTAGPTQYGDEALTGTSTDCVEWVLGYSGDSCSLTCSRVSLECDVLHLLAITTRQAFDDMVDRTHYMRDQYTALTTQVCVCVYVCVCVCVYVCMYMYI